MAKKSRRDGNHLATLIRTGVETALVARLRVAAESEGESLARELLADPEFRADFLAAARAAALDALDTLRRD
jgi:hypothetical protein